MIDIEYQNACAEVLEILKYVSKEDLEKIPKDMIEALEVDKNENYNFKYDINKTLNEQNISKKAKTIIAIFFRDYWATQHQKDVILVNERADRAKKEAELREKYHPDKIFSKNQVADETIKENTELIEYQERNIFIKIIYQLKEIFLEFINKS